MNKLKNTIFCGGNLEVVSSWPSNFISAVITDPPYGLGFMGKDWDTFNPDTVQKKVESSLGTGEIGKRGRNDTSPAWNSARYDHSTKGHKGFQQWFTVWAKAMLRITKPGGFLLCFGGTRTYHRLACAIEDAGWEIRDCMSWIYGSGFPKSHNFPWKMHEKACTLCGNMVEYSYEETQSISKANENSTAGTTRKEQKAKHDLRFVRATYLQTPVYACAECGQILQPFLSKQEIQELRASWLQSKVIWPKQPSLERGSNLETSKGELFRCEICQMSHQIFADGSERWIHNGTSTPYGSIPWQVANADGSCPSYRPQSLKQCHRQSDAFLLEQEAQRFRGYGTAMKPSWEPILVCMKPLDGTFAHNAEKHGVAGLNIDAARIGSEEITQHGRKETWSQSMSGKNYAQKSGTNPHQGRWPANLILDSESAAMLDEQTGNKKSGFMAAGTKRQMSDNPNKNTYGKFNPDTVQNDTYGDSGGTSRFFKKIEGPEPCFLCGYIEEHGNLDIGPGIFLCDECLLQGEALDLPKRFLYCAKTSRKERNMGLEGMKTGVWTDGRRGKADFPKLRDKTERQNTHPTVKPLALMKYLCSLLKMPGSDQIIIDPFLGSGTTGIACKELGINFIGIEKEREYCEIAMKRIAAVEGQEIILHTEPLPVTKNMETVGATTGFVSGGGCPNENSPHVSESKQRIINAAVAALRRNRK